MEREKRGRKVVWGGGVVVEGGVMVVGGGDMAAMIEGVCLGFVLCCVLSVFFLVEG